MPEILEEKGFIKYLMLKNGFKNLKKTAGNHQNIFWVLNEIIVFKINGFFQKIYDLGSWTFLYKVRYILEINILLFFFS